MKLIQLIKHATCIAALSAFIVGCGGESNTDPNDPNDPVNQPAPDPENDGPEDDPGSEGGTEGN